LKDSLEQLISKKVLSAPTAQEAIQGRIETTIAEIRELAATDSSGDVADTLRQVIQAVAYCVSLGQIGAQYANDRDEFQAMNYMWLAISCLRKERWSIVTLNYDLVLDWAFEHVNRMAENDPDRDIGVRQFLRWRELQRYLCAAGPELQPAKHGIYLKPHGDLGLFSCHNTRCERYRQPSLSKSDRFPPYFFGPGAHEYCSSCSGTLVPLIVPPGENKTSGEDSYLATVYSHARSTLATSDTWVILGYSCPEYDHDVTDLMRSALADRDRRQMPVIVIISPEASAVAKRLHERVDCDVMPVQGTFSSLVHDVYWSKYHDGP
jgi:hypothetical protein